jgi:hypothetical protein
MSVFFPARIEIGVNPIPGGGSALTSLRRQLNTLNRMRQAERVERNGHPLINDWADGIRYGEATSHAPHNWC